MRNYITIAVIIFAFMPFFSTVSAEEKKGKTDTEILQEAGINCTLEEAVGKTVCLKHEWDEDKMCFLVLEAETRGSYVYLHGAKTELRYLPPHRFEDGRGGKWEGSSSNHYYSTEEIAMDCNK